MQPSHARSIIRLFLICASITLVIHAVTGDWAGYLSYVLFLGSLTAIFISRPFVWACKKWPIPTWASVMLAYLVYLVVWRAV